ncbi:MAG TPA: hypothetical protein VIM70_06100 [Clostridium sp.]|uniref:hypothetical protein n=1 Tax=Clostridium sp. TaxID=1506 RepID=UPI002F9537D3
MILNLRSIDGAGNYYANNMEFVIRRKFLSSKYILEINGSGFGFENYPHWVFNKKENAERLKQYIVDNFNSDYPTIDIRNIQREILKNE